jgi:hypothetical protein
MISFQKGSIIVQPASNSPNRPAVTEALYTRPNGGRGVDPSPLAGVGALGEREALQLKIDSGGRLTPVEQGTFDRLSALGQPETERLYLAQQEVRASERTNIACKDPHTMIDGFMGLFSTEPKTADNFTIYGATPQDVADLNEALQYLQGTDNKGEWKSETAVDLLASLPDCTKIVLNDSNFTKSLPEFGIIGWDPRSGLVTDNGVQSPALGLAHEIDHVVGFQEPIPTNDGYGDTEERRVITGTETQIANDLGEPTRNDHHGGEITLQSTTAHSNW